MEIFKDSFASDSLLYYIAQMNFLKFSSFFFLYCVAVAVIVSLVTERPRKEKLTGLTFGTITEEQKRQNAESYTWVDIIASIFVIAVVAWVMVYFS